MKYKGMQIENTFAEAFNMKASRIIVTADNLKWAKNACDSFTGFATSVIGCGIEAGIEKQLSKAATPDGRHGYSILLFSMSRNVLEKQLETRVGQCILTCPTTAVFSGIESDDVIPLGKNLRYFGDGHQISKKINKKRFWRIPVMDGEFLCEESTSRVPAIGGGNFLVLSKNRSSCLKACEVAIDSIKNLPNVITPFPGGVVRSGSKIGSKYKTLIASTNDEFCPTLKSITKSSLANNVNCVMEIVINGLDEKDISLAIKKSIQAIAKSNIKKDIVSISAGNYGGKLGQYHFHLRKIIK
jgi:formylmethanofuran--tetrahydromethanopterin N-formyltransferase